MNSMSKGNWQGEKDCGCKKEKEEAGVLLKCKKGDSVCLPKILDHKVELPPLVRFTLNTAHFKNPCIKFDFAANITYKQDGPFILGKETIKVNFQIVKDCKDQRQTPVGPTWAFTRVVPDVNVTTEDTFTFIVCDCDCDCDCDKDDCCTYSVVATVLNNDAIGTINFPTLSALVVEKASRC